MGGSARRTQNRFPAVNKYKGASISKIYINEINSKTEVVQVNESKQENRYVEEADKDEWILHIGESSSVDRVDVR